MTDISHIRLTGRPLIISDVDDVILEFIDPYQRFLNARQLKFLPRSFRLTGNVVRIDDESPVSEEVVQQSLHDFFDEQHVWQTPFQHVMTALPELAEEADIVFLTAMPPKFTSKRRLLLDELGLRFPMVAVETAKGPIASMIRDRHIAPVVFVDDMAHNLTSVAEHLPDCLLLSLAPPSAVHAMAPKPPEAARVVRDWEEATPIIKAHFSTTAGS
ncbi:MAG TPA: hypothetical protein VN112_14220 [Ensifer sp.]|nr:hypothetical protein [Ensifer sp.]